MYKSIINAKLKSNTFNCLYHYNLIKNGVEKYENLHLKILDVTYNTDSKVAAYDI